VLDNWCREVGREPSEIERTVSVDVEELGQLGDYVAAGANQIILEVDTPWDMAPVKRLVQWRDAQGYSSGQKD
jgi:hypothetical protein